MPHGAREELTLILQLDPEHHDARALLGVIEIETGDHKEGLQHLQRRGRSMCRPPGRPMLTFSKPMPTTCVPPEPACPIVLWVPQTMPH